MTNYPRNGSWTDKSVHFFGVPARREEAACSLPATTNQRSWGVKKVCNLVRSGRHPQGELRNVEIPKKIIALPKLDSGQLPFLGLSKSPCTAGHISPILDIPFAPY